MLTCASTVAAPGSSLLAKVGVKMQQVPDSSIGRLEATGVVQRRPSLIVQGQQRVGVSRNKRGVDIGNGAAPGASVVQGRPSVEARVLGAVRVRLGESADCAPVGDSCCVVNARRHLSSTHISILFQIFQPCEQVGVHRQLRRRNMSQCFHRTVP